MPVALPLGNVFCREHVPLSPLVKVFNFQACFPLVYKLQLKRGAEFQVQQGGNLPGNGHVAVADLDYLVFGPQAAKNPYDVGDQLVNGRVYGAFNLAPVVKYGQPYPLPRVDADQELLLVIPQAESLNHQPAYYGGVLLKDVFVQHRLPAFVWGFLRGGQYQVATVGRNVLRKD